MRKLNDNEKEQINAIKRDYIPESNQVASPIVIDIIDRYKKKMQFVN